MLQSSSFIIFDWSKNSGRKIIHRQPENRIIQYNVILTTEMSLLVRTVDLCGLKKTRAFIGIYDSKRKSLLLCLAME